MPADRGSSKPKGADSATARCLSRCYNTLYLLSLTSRLLPPRPSASLSNSCAFWLIITYSPFFYTPISSVTPQREKEGTEEPRKIIRESGSLRIQACRRHFS